MDESKKNEMGKPSPTAGGGKGPGGPAGGPGQSATLASHTSKPLGGGQSPGAQSAGPEHLRHQDKDAGKGMGDKGSGDQGSGKGPDATRSATDTVRQTAAQVGETLRETAADVQERAGEAYTQAAQRASQAYDQASETARGAYREASSWASDAYEQGSRYYDDAARRSAEGFGQARRGVERFVAENPVMVGVIGLAAGLLIGALLPRTRPEDRTLGRWSDEMRDQGMRYARDMAQRGREMVEETFNDEDSRFSSPGGDWRQGEDDGRPGPRGRQRPQGRYQNH